jgi:acyl-CoA reductase-like NAD-dependent aldehyde dehydrogenase
MINGAVLVGSSERQRDPKFLAIDPAKGKELPTAFSSAGTQDVEDACAAAEAAFAGAVTHEDNAFKPGLGRRVLERALMAAAALEA